MTDSAESPSTTQLQAPSAAPDISVQGATGWVDWAVVAAVVAVALWYLYRKLWAKRGECGGCAKGKSGCAVQQANRRAQTEQTVKVPIDRIQRRH
jgi:hypothetical protein